MPGPADGAHIQGVGNHTRARWCTMASPRSAPRRTGSSASTRASSRVRSKQECGRALPGLGSIVTAPLGTPATEGLARDLAGIRPMRHGRAKLTQIGLDTLIGHLLGQDQGTLGIALNTCFCLNLNVSPMAMIARALWHMRQSISQAVSEQAFRIRFRNAKRQATHRPPVPISSPPAPKGPHRISWWWWWWWCRFRRRSK